jgi:hypothetical protein
VFFLLTDPDSGVQNGAYKLKYIVVFEELKGIFQPFELGGETIPGYSFDLLLNTRVKHKVPGKLLKKFLMIHSHEKSIKQISAV